MRLNLKRRNQTYLALVSPGWVDILSNCTLVHILKSWLIVIHQVLVISNKKRDQWLTYYCVVKT